MSAIILSVLLGVLLLSAAALKSAQPSGLTAQEAVALGLPKTLAAGWRARCAVVLLVGIEVGLAVGLQVPAAVRVAAASAFAFFVATGALLARAMRRGSAVPCGCFGCRCPAARGAGVGLEKRSRCDDEPAFGDPRGGASGRVCRDLVDRGDGGDRRSVRGRFLHPRAAQPRIGRWGPTGTGVKSSHGPINRLGVAAADERRNRGAGQAS